MVLQINLENTVMDKKPVSKAHLLYNVIYLKYPDKSIEEERELIDGFFLLGWEREDWGEVGLALMGTEGDQHVQKLIMVMAAQLLYAIKKKKPLTCTLEMGEL